MEAPITLAIVNAIVELWGTAQGSLKLSAVHDYLRAEGIEVPDKFMAATVEDLAQRGFIMTEAQAQPHQTITWINPRLWR